MPRVRPGAVARHVRGSRDERRYTGPTRMSWPLPCMGASSRYSATRCCASLRSRASSTLSSTKYNRSKREMSVGGRSMFCVTVCFGSYFEPIGFAPARIDVRALRVVMIPAFAMETVCCSCRSCMNGRLETIIGMCTHHDFMQNTSSRVRHLVKLIDTAYTAVAQHKGATVRADG